MIAVFVDNSFYKHKFLVLTKTEVLKSHLVLARDRKIQPGQQIRLKKGFKVSFIENQFI